MSDLPPDAVEAAAEAMEDEAMRLLGRDLGTIHRNEIAAAALSAALPALREALAQEIRWAKRNHPPTSEKCARCDALDYAARVVRGGEAEEGRRLANERDDLIAQGVDPAELLIPLAPPCDHRAPLLISDEDYERSEGVCSSCGARMKNRAGTGWGDA